jgi:hypothetical protein
MKKMKDIGEDLEEFANYILEELKQSQGEVSNWDVSSYCNLHIYYHTQ